MSQFNVRGHNGLEEQTVPATNTVNVGINAANRALLNRIPTIEDRVDQIENAVVGGVLPTQHNQLIGIQGGNADHRYHLDEDEKQLIDDLPGKLNVINGSLQSVKNSILGLQSSVTNINNRLTVIEGGAGGGGGNTIVGGEGRTVDYGTPGTYMWQVPADVSQIRVTACAGGGGGGGTSWSPAPSGGGGGGGEAIVNQIFTVTPSSALNLTVSSGGGAGSNGGSTVIGNLITLLGGAAGAAGAAGGAGGAAGGPGGGDGGDGGASPTAGEPGILSQGGGSTGGGGSLGGGGLGSGGSHLETQTGGISAFLIDGLPANGWSGTTRLITGDSTNPTVSTGGRGTAGGGGGSAGSASRGGGGGRGGDGYIRIEW